MTAHTYTYNGLTIGHATDYMVESVTGLFELPPIKDQGIPKQDGDGDFPGFMFFGPRVIQFKINILSDLRQAATGETPAAAIGYNLQQLSQKWCPFRDPFDAFDLTFTKPWGGADEQGFTAPKARVTKRAFPTSADMTLGLATGAIELKVDDPGLYVGGTLMTTTLNPGESMNLPNHGGGYMAPLIQYLGSGGPSTAPPKIQNVINGSFLSTGDNFIGSSSSPLTFDTVKKTVIGADGGRADLWVTLDSDFFGMQIPPGQLCALAVSGTGPWSVTTQQREFAL